MEQPKIDATSQGREAKKDKTAPEILHLKKLSRKIYVKPPTVAVAAPAPPPKPKAENGCNMKWQREREREGCARP